jgi:hypothetical protein
MTSRDIIGTDAPYGLKSWIIYFLDFPYNYTIFERQRPTCALN